jgi:hypothetical protein
MSTSVDIADRLAAEQEAFPWWERPVLTTSRAIIYVGVRSEDALRKRLKRWGVAQCDDGMWPRHAIDRAMSRVSKKSFQSNRGRKRVTA